MKAPLAGIILGFVLLAPAHGLAQTNATLVVTQPTLNRLVGRMGALSASGTHQPRRVVESVPLFQECVAIGFLDCPELGKDPAGFDRDRIPLAMCRTASGGIALVPLGELVSWQWWVTGARFTLQNNAMNFTATVRSRVDGNEKTTTRTVPASVVFDAPANRVVVRINAFSVPVEYTRSGTTSRVTTVDVAKLFSMGIRVEPQTIVLPPIQGTASKTFTGKVASIPGVVYRPGEVEVRFDVQFTPQ